MSNIFQSITNSVFGASDPIGLSSALLVLYKNSTDADRAVLDDPSSLPGLELTRALQVVVDRNDVACIMLLFSKERATYILNTEKPTSPKHTKGLKLLSELLELPPTVFDQLFGALVDHNRPWFNLPLEEMVASFVADVRHALTSHAQHKKLTRAISHSPTVAAHKKI